MLKITECDTWKEGLYFNVGNSRKYLNSIAINELNELTIHRLAGNKQMISRIKGIVKKEM